MTYSYKHPSFLQDVCSNQESEIASYDGPNNSIHGFHVTTCYNMYRFALIRSNLDYIYIYISNQINTYLDLFIVGPHTLQ